MQIQIVDVLLLQDGNGPLHIAAQSFKPDSREWEEFIFDIIRLGGCNAQ